MNHDHYAIASQYDVWMTRQVFGVKAITTSCGMQRPPDQQLRLGVLATESAHEGPSLLGRENRHSLKMP
jgi:hypothetical protein